MIEGILGTVIVLVILGVFIFSSGAVGYKMGYHKGQADQIVGGVWVELNIDDKEYEGFMTRIDVIKIHGKSQ